MSSNPYRTKHQLPTARSPSLGTGSERSTRRRGKGINAGWAFHVKRRRPSHARRSGGSVTWCGSCWWLPQGQEREPRRRGYPAHYAIAHLSSGELLRKEVAADTKIGRIAVDYLRRGDLVPDELVIEILAGPVLQAVANGGYVLDGFPRTLRQAEEAYRVAQQIEGIDLQAVVHLEVRREELRRRLLARAEQEGRGDDNDVVITHRLEIFDSETEPLLGFYRGRGLMVDINGEQPIDAVFADIVSAVDRLRADRQ